MKLTVRKFRIFCNSLKLTIKNFYEFIEKKFRNFILLNSLKNISKIFQESILIRLLKKNSKFSTAEFIEKNFEKFLQSISLKKQFDIFTENSKKKHFLPQKKGGHRGNPNNFSGKSDMTFRWVLTSVPTLKQKNL